MVWGRRRGLPKSLSLYDFILIGPTWVTITSRVKCTVWPGLVTSFPGAKDQGEIHQNQMDWVVGERHSWARHLPVCSQISLHHREHIFWKLELWWA